VPQQPALYSKLSALENLRLFARLERVAEPEATAWRMLEQLGLTERAHDRVESLSGGNRQRVNVALGLLGDPPVALLDEPSTALDPDQRQRLWTFVCDLAARGTCVLYSTHIVSEAASHADRVLVLDEGRLLFDGAPAELVRTVGGAGGDARAGTAGDAAVVGASTRAGAMGDAGDATVTGAARGEDFERAFVAFLRERRAQR
jgi:ABC-2 type transport system ATP-binding protein